MFLVTVADRGGTIQEVTVRTVALKDVTKIFADGTIAVNNLNLDVAAGELMVLLGQYGCGKSTVLRMVAGLEDPSSGAIMLGGVLANDMPPQERRIATGLPDSGGACVLAYGPRRRVAPGPGAPRQPGLFLLDEPLSGYDSGLRPKLRTEISVLVRQLGVTTIYVTDDQAEALTVADRVAVLRRGVLQDVGTPTQIYNRPATLYVAAFLGSHRMNLLEAQVEAHPGQHVALHLGAQSLRLPWDDARSRALAHHHGGQVVVGVRAEALTPASPAAAGNVLRGRIRHVERRGRESLARVDIGATGVVVEDLDATAANAIAGRSRLRRINQSVQRPPGRARAPMAGRVARSPEPCRACTGTSATGAVKSGGDPGRHRRRPADLVMQAADPEAGAGESMAVAVRMDALHLFDDLGRRIDAGWRNG